MKCETFNIPNSEDAKLYTYVLDSEISFEVHRKWPAMIILPGGGYILTATKEGEGAAMKFLAQGFHCFVLRYTTYIKNRKTLEVNENFYYPKPEIELMEAIHIIHEHAEEWNIDLDNIFLNGYSAGGHICTSVALKYHEFIKDISFEPKENEFKIKGLVLGYPMLYGNIHKYILKNKDAEGNIVDQLTYIMNALDLANNSKKLEVIHEIKEDSTSFFIWHTNEDRVVDPMRITEFVHALQSKQVPCEYHLFSHGPHGLCMADEVYAKNDKEIDADIAMWFPLAIHWLKGRMREHDE